MNKQKRFLTLDWAIKKDIISFEDAMANIRPPFYPDVTDTPSDFSNIDPEIRKAMENNEPF